MKTQHEFSQVPRADIPRSSFNLSHGLKTTFDVDLLVPILVMDIIPGDTMNVRASHFCRLATPLFPIGGAPSSEGATVNEKSWITCIWKHFSSSYPIEQYG